MPVLPATIVATMPIMPLVPNVEDLVGRTVKNAPPVLPATFAATHPNGGIISFPGPVEKRIAGEAEKFVELAQLATIVAVVLNALGIGSEFANANRKVLMRRVGGLIESLDVQGQPMT